MELHSFYQKQNSTTSTQCDKWFKTHTTLRYTLFNQKAEQTHLLSLRFQKVHGSNFHTQILTQVSRGFPRPLQANELPYFPAHKTGFFPRKMWPKFDLRLMRRGYHFQTYKYPYIYYTTSLSKLLKFASKSWDLASLLVNGLLSYPGIYPNVYIASHVIPALRCVIPVLCVTRWEGEGSSKQHN